MFAIWIRTNHHHMAASRVYKVSIPVFCSARLFPSFCRSHGNSNKGSYATRAQNSSSTMIQGCPVEVLDRFFEFAAYSDPRKAQVTLRSLMLTCSYIRTIARRHFIDIVCLPNAEKVIEFGGYLKQVVGGGDYGKGVLPIQHLAVAGDYRGKRNNSLYSSAAATKAANIIPFIIATAAPTLFTLTILGVQGDHRFIFTGGSIHPKPRCQNCVIDRPIFPKLHDLVALEQDVLLLVTRDEDGNPDNQACQLQYPSLRRLYVHGTDGGALPSTLPYLADLRLNMLPRSCIPPPPREELDHVRSLIIDAPIPSFCFDFDGSGSRLQREYNSKYRTLIEEVGNPERNGVILSIDSVYSYKYGNRDCILSAWADTVVGGDGCWTTAWVLTK